ncbi:MAG: hypothetical protein ACI9DQ_000210, partial [Glaciecola sp.]
TDLKNRYINSIASKAISCRQDISCLFNNQSAILSGALAK